jgi:hypothetical protein
MAFGSIVCALLQTDHPQIWARPLTAGAPVAAPMEWVEPVLVG